MCEQFGDSAAAYLGCAGSENRGQPYSWLPRALVAIEDGAAEEWSNLVIVKAKAQNIPYLLSSW
jgi:hypothetical protein